MTPESSPAADVLEPFAGARQVLLATRKRDGTWVDTPVNLAVEGDHAYFRTWSTAGKAKRLRNFDEVRLAPCTARGRPTGPARHARATLLDGDEARRAARLLAAKHPVLQRVFVPLMHRVLGRRTQHYRVTDVEP